MVQERLFDRLDLLLSKEGAAPELAECLTEVSIAIPISVSRVNLLAECLN